MRILSVVRQHYYGNPNAREPLSFFFTTPLLQMGHDVETFDHFEARRACGKDHATEQLISKIRGGAFDLVFYQTSGDEPVDTSALADTAAGTCLAAWNSDDDWQWATTRRLASDFSYMITTYPHVYEQHRAEYPNLLLSQWGCLGLFSNFDRKKDIDFSFAGAVYAARSSDCRYLRRRAGLKCFGRGARLQRLGIPYFRGAFKLHWLAGKPLRYEGIYSVWNRTRVSYTPMTGGPQGEVLSIKARTFEMGLSGTLMLCEHSPHLERYYEPGRECITFETLADCAEKALWYLSHESERARIARNYYERTLREHMWGLRFTDLFRQMRITEGKTTARRAAGGGR
ncbi:MAG: glycosyltransferase [Candidatus Acidiferrales bacterium]